MKLINTMAALEEVDDLLSNIKEAVQKDENSKVNGYYQRNKHLLKLINQQNDLIVDKCPICGWERWRGFVCPNSKCKT